MIYKVINIQNIRLQTDEGMLYTIDVVQHYKSDNPSI